MEPAKLGRFVKGELDWIVMKALSKERDRRYETPNESAPDVERFLNNEPVTAGPPDGCVPVPKVRPQASHCPGNSYRIRRSSLSLRRPVSAGLAIWANRERARALAAERSAKDEQARAQNREQLAIDAVRRYGDVVSENHELKTNPGLAKLRATLLKEPQAFFKRLRDRLQADRETTPESLARLADGKPRPEYAHERDR